MVAIESKRANEAEKQLAAARAAIADHNSKVFFGGDFDCYKIPADTTALDAAIEQKRLEIWADAPNQPDVQEAVIAKLDLVHRHAIETALAANREKVQTLVELLKTAIRCGRGLGREWREKSKLATQDWTDYNPLKLPASYREFAKAENEE